MLTEINGIQQFLSIKNEQANTTLIFVHGFPFNQSTWDKQVSAMPANIRVLTYDIRGFGKSETGDGQYTIELFTDDLIAIIDKYCNGKAIVCGLSMGGYIALRLTEKAPERLLGLILCDTKPDAEDNTGKIKRAQTAELIKTKGMEVYSRSSIANLLSAGTLRDNPALVEYIHQIISTTSPLAACGATIAMAARTDTWSCLSALDIPVLMIKGDEDKLITDEKMRKMAALVSRSGLQIIAGAGHLPNLEKPDVFNDTILKWLEENEFC